MSMSVKVVTVDDIAMHRMMLKQNLEMASKKSDLFDFTVEAELEDGQHLVDRIGEFSPDLITLDIRMPEMDGLSTLCVLRQRLGIKVPVLMVSSEQEDNISRYEDGMPDAVKQMSADQKFANLAKIEARLVSGHYEEGKINRLLEGCEKLGVDPAAYAERLGANGFLVKPYSPAVVQALLPEVINGKSFAASTRLV
jgi:two-component system chemotaxis response regulator CheY